MFSVSEELGHFEVLESTEIIYKLYNCSLDSLPPGGYLIRLDSGNLLNSNGEATLNVDIIIDDLAFTHNFLNVFYVELWNNRLLIKIPDTSMGSLNVAVYRYVPRHLWHMRREKLSTFDKDELEKYIRSFERH